MGAWIDKYGAPKVMTFCALLMTGSYRLACMLHVAAFLAAAVAIRFLPRPLTRAARVPARAARS